MEVAGLILTAIAFLDPAIRAGKALSEVAKDYPTAGKQIHNATRRLEAQKYTLQVWESTWTRRALGHRKHNIEDGYREIWGSEGYSMVVNCLVQLNVKFGEALRTLRSIDPDSFANNKYLQPVSVNLTQSLSSKDQNTTQQLKSPATEESAITERRGQPHTKVGGKKSDRWYRLLSRSPSRPWRRSGRNSPTAQDQGAETEAEALQQKLSPGTKFTWSLLTKDDLRLQIGEIEEWLEQLRSLAVSCAEERQESSNVASDGNPRNIREAARALYSAVLNGKHHHQLDFKLEQERNDSGYFDRVIGPVSYLDRSNQSFKFPILITSNTQSGQNVVILAEAIFLSSSTQQTLPTDKETSFEDLVNQLTKAAATSHNNPATVLFRSAQTIIVVHEVPDAEAARHLTSVTEKLDRCSFAEVVKAGSSVDTLLALWKRLQLACTIAISVLHLYETGWISSQLTAGDFHFFGPADRQYDELTRMSPYVSPSNGKAQQTTKTPFDCLRRVQLSQALVGTQDERLATLFYRLGIVLFEIGRGGPYGEFLSPSKEPRDGNLQNTSDDMLLVLEEIDKIPFGRPYRDLVKLCLTGSLYATSVANIDGQFNAKVVQEWVTASLTSLWLS
jgi:hypothetical protein